MKSGRGAGSNWFFVYNIPPELRGLPQFMTRNGKPMTKITESLGTTDYSEARMRRDERIVYWNRQFRMLRDGPSEDDIREEAVEVYRATLKRESTRQAVSGTGIAFPILEYNAAHYLEELDSAIASHVRQEVVDYCKRIGAEIQPGTEAYRKIGIKFLEAKIAAGGCWVTMPLPDGRTLRWDEQHLPPLPKIDAPVTSERQPPLPAAPLTRRETETFSEAFEAYRDTELDGAKPDTIAEYQRKVKIFIDKVGNVPLNKVTDHLAVEFLDKCLLRERELTKKTRNGYAMLFSAIYKSAMRRKKANHNPFDGQLVKAEAVHYEPFTDQELVTLFAGLPKFEISPAKHNTNTAVPWVSLISAYTGCRLEEAVQLKAADVKQTEGIWHFEFCHGGNGKTKAATRTVPLHPALIDAGLLRYRDALPSGSLLFPGLKGKQSKVGSGVGDMFR